MLKLTNEYLFLNLGDLNIKDIYRMLLNILIILFLVMYTIYLRTESDVLVDCRGR